MATNEILYKFGIDRFCLKQIGLNEKATNDFYRSLYILVTGFHNMINMIVGRITLQNNVIPFLSKVWEVYLYLLEKGNTKFYDDLYTQVEKNRKEDIDKIKRYYENKIEELNNEIINCKRDSTQNQILRKNVFLY